MARAEKLVTTVGINQRGSDGKEKRWEADSPFDGDATDDMRARGYVVAASESPETPDKKNEETV
jgi:hypothetical protein